MKILHVATHYFPFSGGIEQLIFDLSTAQKKFSDVAILSCKFHKNLPNFEKKNGVEIWRAPKISILKNRFPLPIFGFSKILQKINPDLIFTHGRFFLPTFLAGNFAKKFAKKWVHVEHSADFLRSKNFFINFSARIVDEFLGKKNLKNTDAIVVLSEKAKNFVQKFSGAKKIFIIENGVKIPRKISPLPQKNCAVFAGRMVAEKGICEISAAAKICKNWNFKFFGEFLCENFKKKFLKNLPKNAEFCGKISREKVVEKFAAADLVLLPSTNEGFSLAALEAAAAGRAILGTDSGANAKIISKNFLIKFGDARKLAEKLHFLENNFSILKKVGRENFQKVQNFSCEKMLQKYENLVRKFFPEIFKNEKNF